MTSSTLFPERLFHDEYGDDGFHDVEDGPRVPHTITYERSDVPGKWYVETERRSTTPRGFKSISQSIARDVAADMRANRGGNVLGTSRFRVLIDGREIRLDTWLSMTA